MQAFLRLAVCVVAAVVLCSAVASAELVQVDKAYYKLGEDDSTPAPAIGTPGLDPTIDSLGYLNLARVGTLTDPKYAAGAPSAVPASTLSMEFSGIGTDTPATQYYTGLKDGALFTTNNFGLDFWVKIKAFPELSWQGFVCLGEFGTWNGGKNWGFTIGTISDRNGDYIHAAGNGYGWTGTTDLNTDQWYHVRYESLTPTGIHEHDDNAHIYIDGVEETGAGNMPFVWEDGGTEINNAITIGARDAQPYRFDWGANAMIDEVRVFELVPEPGTLAMLAGGLLGLLCYAWRKRK